MISITAPSRSQEFHLLGHHSKAPGSPVNHLEGNDPQLFQDSHPAKPRWGTLGLMTPHFQPSPPTVFEHRSWQPQNVQYWQGGAVLKQDVPWDGMMQKEEGTRTRNFFKLPENKGSTVSDSSLFYFSRHCFNKSWGVITLEIFYIWKEFPIQIKTNLINSFFWIPSLLYCDLANVK